MPLNSKESSALSDNFYTALGLVMRKYLRQKNFIEKELSVLLGMHESTVSRLLNGKRKLFFDEAISIARVIGVSPQELADEALKMLENPEFHKTIDDIDSAKENVKRFKARVMEIQ